MVLLNKVIDNRYIKFLVLLLIVLVIVFIVYRKKRKKLSGLHTYKLGDKWKDGFINNEDNFDSDGMLTLGEHVNIRWKIEDLQKLYSSFEDVNFHNEAVPLGKAINHLQSADKRMKQFNLLCKNSGYE